MSITSTRRLPRAFTLAELIIVMMIIVLLLSILLPALSAARDRAKKAATRTQLANITSACETYMLAFSGSAPGYCSEIPATGANTRYLTSTENLVLSLLGGVVINTTGWVPTGWNIAAGFSTTRSVDFTKIGTGPTSATGRIYGAFYSPKPNELIAIDVLDGSWWSDNSMPELVDPSTGMPILYYRATTVATPLVGTFSDGTTPSGTFLRGFNHVYVSGKLTAPGGDTYPQTTDSTLTNVAPGTNANADVNLAWMIANRSLSTLGDGPNGANDLASGSFVVISAGPDGIYANKGSIAGSMTITSTADVDAMDDIVMSGGG